MIALIIIFIGAMLCLYFGLNKSEKITLPTAITSLLLAAGVSILQTIDKKPWNVEKWLGGDMLIFNQYAFPIVAVLCIATALILMVFSFKNDVGADLIGLILFSLTGGIMLTGYTHLVTMFMGIEILSIPLYVLAGSNKYNLQSNEAAIKYFLMGAFSTAFLLLGCAMLYGGTGDLYITHLYEVSEQLGHNQLAVPLVFIGLILVLVGFLFKVAAVPFHFWSPDVYQGSPNRAVMFMATVVKISAFAGLVRLFAFTFFDLREVVWFWVVSIAAVASILIGNIAGAYQTNFKRLIAYSGVAQTGYMLIGLLANNQVNAFWGVFVYSTAYIFASIIVFTIITAVHTVTGNTQLQSFSNLAPKNKLPIIALVVALLSMAGIPLTMGFTGKYLLFTNAFNIAPWVVGFALLGSLIGITVYFKVLKTVLFTSDSTMPEITFTTNQKIVLTISTIILIILGTLPMVLKPFYAIIS